VSAQPITAPVFNSSPPPRTLIVVTATPLGCATGLSGRRVLADATSKNPPDEGHGFSRATLRHRMRASVSSGPSSLTKDGWPISRSFFARCGIPLRFPSDSRFTRCT
jgi:hypothetical protein